LRKAILSRNHIGKVKLKGVPKKLAWCRFVRAWYTERGATERNAITLQSSLAQDSLFSSDDRFEHEFPRKREARVIAQISQDSEST
jgi:hypothetical protein